MFNVIHSLLHIWILTTIYRGRSGRHRLVIWFITIWAISAYHHQRCEIEPRTGEVYSVQHYVIKFVSDLRQVSGFLWLLRFPPPIKLKYCWKWCYKNINQSNQPTNHLVNNTNKEWMEDQNVKKKLLTINMKRKNKTI
jgi:hypothetical protein